MVNGKIVDSMIPPRVTKGQLIAGNTREQKIAVPVGEDGSFLQADSTTETGLRWVKINLPDESYQKKIEDEIMQLRTQLGKMNDSLFKMQFAQIKKSMENINMHGHGGKRHSKRNRRTHKKHHL
jgi:TolA-binding protein